MKNKIEILGIIPARSGSKTIKNKNLIKIKGNPLIYYTLKEAKKSKLISKLIVSTDSIKIANFCKRKGAEIPFMRPKKISRDNSKDSDVINHAYNFFFKKKIIYKYKKPECCSELLYSLNNKNHFLYTGMIFMVNNKIIKKKLTKTKVNFGNNDKKNIKRYVEKNFSSIKNAVGCYNIEGSGINLFKNISKSYFNVLGLDIISFLKFMRKI